MRLSKRMHMVADLVTPGMVLADIGCDHGYLSVWLVREKIVSRAIAMDLREGPLNKAKESIAFFHQEAVIETRLSDGMDLLKPGEADRIVIAGMGGILMRDILQRGKACCENAEQLVLQPQSDSELVRREIQEQGFRIEDEQACLEDGKYYIAFSCVKGNETIPYSDVELKYGRILAEKRDETFLSFLREELMKKEAMYQRLREAGTELAKQRIKPLTDEISEIQHMID